MLLKIHPETPAQRQLLQVVETLKNGGIVVCPTDTVYGIVCDMNNRNALNKVAQLKGTSIEKANFSVLCYDLSHIAEFTKPFNNQHFKLMKRNLPGPFTFILNASNKIPKIFQTKKKTIGIRVPDNNIAREIVHLLGNPIVTTSVHDDDEILDYITDPELIHEKLKDQVDIVIDGGFGNNEGSTVVSLVNEEFEILRQGIGMLE